MFKVSIITVGKIKERALAQLIGEYVKRLGRYCALRILEVDGESISARESDVGMARLVAVEAVRLSGLIKSGDYVIALDAGGKAPDSPEFADMMERLKNSRPSVTFVIGGSNGLDKRLLASCDMCLSLSNMTFLHQFARLILLEQLYRAFKINNNETYHK